MRQILVSWFGFQQEGFGLQAACEAGQFAVGADYSVARDDDGDGISSVGRSDCADSFWTPNLSCDVSIAASLAERDGRERSPHFLLKIGSSEVELQGKFLEFAREVIVELVLSLKEHRMSFIFHQRCEADSFRIVIFPQDRG
jgi:hypothetical protein